MGSAQSFAPIQSKNRLNNAGILRARPKGTKKIQEPQDAAKAGLPLGAVGKEEGLGDITGGLETTMDYLPNFTPLERIAITATVRSKGAMT